MENKNDFKLNKFNGVKREDLIAGLCSKNFVMMMMMVLIMVVE